MDGTGTLTRDRDILDGHWDAERRVGWGRIKVGTVTRISSWKLKNGELSTADEEGMWLSDNITDSDCNFLLGNCTSETKPAGTLLIEQGRPNLVLLRCKTGTMKIQKTLSDGSKVHLAIVEPGTLLGETAALSVNIATADVICDTVCEVESVNINLLSTHLFHNPALCMRFYRHLARKMATILKGIHAPAKRGENRPKTRAPAHKPMDIESPHAKFNLSHNAVFFISTICTHHMFPKNRRGTLYLFDSMFVFESHSFGANEILQKPLSKFNDIVYKKDILTFHGKQKTKDLIFLGVKLDPVLVNSIWTEFTQKQDTGASKVLPKELKTDQTSKLIDMGKDDWKIVLGLAVEKKFNRGDYILKEGEERDVAILQLETGRVKITKSNEDGTQKVIGMAEAGGQDPPLFGEMSFVESTSGRASASANIIADSDDVTFSILEGVKLFCLFVAQPQMAGRFYSFLANLVARRVAEREAAALDLRINK